MTPNAAAGILRRRQAYLERVVHGKHASNQPHRHEDQEIEALGVALDLLNRGCPVTPHRLRSPQPSPTQGDRHG
jgi:hypothetical protein